MTILTGLMLAAAISKADLVPTGRWSVEYADTMCVLSHAYGDPAAPMMVALRPFAVSTNAELVLVSSAALARQPQGAATITAGPDKTTPRTRYTSRFLPAMRRTLTIIQFDMKDLGDPATLAAITLRLDNSPPVHIPLPGFKAAWDATAPCQKDLLTRWKIDPDEAERIGTPASNVQPGWVKVSDYPTKAVAEGRSGTTAILWRVGTDGRVHDCRVVGRSGSADLDQAACTVMTKNGRFTPALDRAGVPMDTHKFMRFHWSMP